jgi:zinc/manganese transport system ATP-binding protein
MGYLPQTHRASSPVAERLSGRDFIACAVQGRRFGWFWMDKATRCMIDRALCEVDASDLAHRPLAEMSGGERQRLLFACCLLDEPRILLLDEPLISLDPHHQHSIVQLAKSLQQRLGITVLFCAHELNPLLEALDRVLYLGRGQAALGRVDEVICTSVLSRLYGADIEVLHANGRVFVMSGNAEIEKEGHRHDV